MGGTGEAWVSGNEKMADTGGYPPNIHPLLSPNRGLILFEAAIRSDHVIQPRKRGKQKLLGGAPG